MNTSAQSAIINPLTALVTTNTKKMLFGGRVLLTILAAGFPVIILLLWRAIWFVYPSLQGRFDAGFEIYGVLCAAFYMQFLVPILALMKGLTTFAEERDEGTIMYLFLRPVPRFVLVLGKFIAYWLTTSIILGVSLGLSFTLLGTVGDMDMLIYDAPTFIKDLWILALGLGTYGAILMIAGVLFKKGVIAGILFFIWDFTAAYIPGSAYRFTVKHYIESIFPHKLPIEGLADLLSVHPPSSMLTCILTLLIITIISLSITTVIIKYKEFGAMQNVE